MYFASKINTKSNLVLLGILIAAFFVAIGSVSAAELNVSKTPTNNDYSDIATAIDNSDNDDIITIYDGIYSGEKNTKINISKSITIPGASYANKSNGKTIIDGSSSGGSIFYINDGINVNIYGITFRNSDYLVSGAIDSYGTLNIRNSEFVDNFIGVSSVGKVDISNSNFTGNKLTALKIDSVDSIIQSSNFISNAVALEVSGSNNKINYNRIHGNFMDIINYGTITDINFNWWGNNKGNVVSQTVSGSYNLIKLYWFVLELSSDSNVALENSNANYTGGDLALLKYKLTTNEQVPFGYGFDLSLLPIFKVYLTNPDGTKVTLDSNQDYSFRLTGFKGNVSYFNLLADGEAINYKISFINGIVPTIQPVFGCTPEEHTTKTKTSNQGTYTGSPNSGSDDVSYSSSGSNSNTYGNQKSPSTKTSDVDNKGNSENPMVKASMKKSAIPFFAIIFSIFAIAGVFIKKN